MTVTALSPSVYFREAVLDLLLVGQSTSRSGLACEPNPEALSVLPNASA